MSKIKLNAPTGGGSVSLEAPSSTTSNADIELKLPVADGSSGQAITTNGSGQLAFASVAVGGASNIAFNAGYGIDFSANSNTGGMTSELLDSYEEGTWTPTFSSTGATFVYNHQSGSYQKVGNTVHVQFYITLSANNSSGLSSNAISINLPFTATGYNRYEAAASFGMIYNIDLTGFGNPYGAVYQSNSYILIKYADDDSTGGSYSSDRFDRSGAGISGSITYRI